MNKEPDTSKTELVDAAKAAAAILGLPLALFAVINTFISQPIISLVIALIVAVLASVWVVLSHRVGATGIIIGWLSLTVVVLASFVIWPRTMTVEGTVRDSKGNLLNNEEVLLFDIGGRRYEARTNATGFYQFTQVPTGVYRLLVRDTEVQGETKGILVRVVQQNVSVPQHLAEASPTPLPVPVTPETLEDTEIVTETTDTSISDDFSIRSLRWPIGEDSNERSISRKYVANGIYHWETTALTSTAVTVEPAIPIFTDFDLSVDVKQVKGPSDILYGVSFRSNSHVGWYIFAIRNKGDFLLGFLPSSGGFTWLIPWSDTTAIGVDQNNLRVVASGDKLRLYVNGEFIGEAIADESKYGKVGLYVSLREGDDVAFEIDNFQITPLDE